MPLHYENPYAEHINRVQDYIENHLEETLTTKQLSQIAHFSEYHFQRIYGLITGESVYGFIKRVRLEKAAYMLLADLERPLMDIALSVGFGNQASFAKAFKSKYGVSGSCYRKAHGRISANDKSSESNSVCGHTQEMAGTIEPSQIVIRKEKAMALIYTRYVGPYRGDSQLFSLMFRKLFQWANERQLITADTRWFVIYHDVGKETEEAQLRLSVCMSVRRSIPVSGNMGILTLAEGTYGVGSFMVASSEYGKAWHYMYTKWLPHCGYIPDDRFSLENTRGRFFRV